MATILIIEDEPSILLGLQNAMLKENYEILIAQNGKQGLKFALQEKIDLIILDIMLPELNGFEVLERFRQENASTPVIILTAKGQENDKLKGFKQGADDYMVKPFSVKELVERVKTIIKRCQANPVTQDFIKVGKFKFNFTAMSAVRDGKPANFSTRELEVLKSLVSRPGEIINRDQILEEVWGYTTEQDISTRTVDNYIVRLRKKIELDPNQPKHIITVHGLGYRFQK